MIEPEAHRASLDVDDASYDVLLHLRSALLLHRQLMHRLMAEKGTHPGQAACIWTLTDNDGISQTDLAAMMQLSRPTLTTMLQKLERAGLVRREDDEADQRITRIFLTPQGREKLAELRTAFSDVAEMTIGPMPETDRRELARLLEGLCDNMRNVLQARDRERRP